MSDRFYTNSALFPGPVTLEGPEAHHLATVRRFRAGDAVVLFNGDGREYPAEVLATSRKSVALNVLRIESPARELPLHLELAAPLPRGDRGDFLIEKLTELGVSRFVPLRTERSVVHPRDSKLDRLQRAVIEASKQCGRNVLMQIQPLADWLPYCRDAQASQRLLADATGPALAPSCRDGALARDVCLAVGPEGGFTDAEVKAGRDAGWQVVSLGPRTLRVETAAMALAALFAVELGPR